LDFLWIFFRRERQLGVLVADHCGGYFDELKDVISDSFGDFLKCCSCLDGGAIDVAGASLALVHAGRRPEDRELNLIYRWRLTG
jgi:hypothetical protein